MHRERSLSGYLRTLANALVQELGQGLDTLGLTPAQGMFLHRIWYCREVLGQGLCAKDLERSEERRVGKECRSRWSPYH